MNPIRSLLSWVARRRARREFGLQLVDARRALLELDQVGGPRLLPAPAADLVGSPRFLLPPPPPPPAPAPSEYQRIEAAQPRRLLEYSMIDAATSTIGDSMTPERWVRLVRDADAGYPAPYMHALEAIVLRDGHLRGQIEARLDEPLNAPQEITAPLGDKRQGSVTAATVLAESVPLELVAQLVEGIMPAIGVGYAYGEITWADRGDGWIVPAAATFVPPQRIVFDAAARARLVVEGNTWPGEELTTGAFTSWIRAERRRYRLPTRGGLLRTAALLSLFKGAKWRDWLIYAEKYGIPYLLGIYDDDSSQAQRDELTNAVKAVGLEGRAIMSKHTEIKVEDKVARGGGGGDTVIERIIDRADAEISKLILGATLNTDAGGPGSYALGAVHQTRAFKLSAGDARWVGRVFARDVGAEFVRRNGMRGVASAPVLQCHVRQQLDPLTEARVYETLGRTGLALSAEQIRGRMALAAPVNEADAVRSKTDGNAQQGNDQPNQ